MKGLQQKDSFGDLIRSSVPFYTGRYGYKLRLLLQEIQPVDIPFGNLLHYSDRFADLPSFYFKRYKVSLVIMKGEYDAILPWPFDNIVTVTLIDQRENRLTRQNLVERVDPLTSGAVERIQRVFSRPQTEENQKFFVMEILHKTMLERRYVVDDTLFFQVVTERKY